MHSFLSNAPLRSVLTCTLAVLLSAAAPGALAQLLPAEQQIAAAVSPAPEELQEGAKVLGYDENNQIVTLREGSNPMICLADDPTDDRFHVACYHESLEPFMARGRELRAQQTSREEIMRIREEEARAGTLQMPSGPAALYSFTGPSDSFDPATGQVEGASRLYVVYIPYATAESTGLSPEAEPGKPWIMNPGKPWAHIMLMPD